MSKLLMVGWSLLSLFLLGVAGFINRKTIVGLLFKGNPGIVTIQRLSGSEIFQTVLLLFVWILLSFSISLATSTFQFWYMYIPTIPFSGLVAIALIEPLQYLKGSRAASFNSKFGAVWISFTAACLTVYLFVFSPLINLYGEWKDSAELSSIVLDEVSHVSAELPPGTTIRLEGLPEGIASYASEIPHVHSVRYLSDYSIKSWLDLVHPGNGINVTASNYAVYGTYPRTLRFDAQPQQNGNILIVVEPVD